MLCTTAGPPRLPAFDTEGNFVCDAGMVGCGLATDFPQLLAARCVTGVGSALQNTGAQLFLADISTTENRAQCLGTNQARPAAP